MEHFDAFQHLCFLKGAGRGLGLVSQCCEKPWESSLLTPHQGLAGFTGLEKPLDQLEGKRKVLQAELSTCQHSQSISKSRSGGNAPSSALGNKPTPRTAHVWSCLESPLLPGPSLPVVASGILHEPGKIPDGWTQPGESRGVIAELEASSLC